MLMHIQNTDSSPVDHGWGSCGGSLGCGPPRLCRPPDRFSIRSCRRVLVLHATFFRLGNLSFEISAQNQNGLRKAGSLSAARLERCDGSEVNPAIERVALMNRSSPRTRWMGGFTGLPAQKGRLIFTSLNIRPARADQKYIFLACLT